MDTSHPLRPEDQTPPAAGRDRKSPQKKKKRGRINWKWTFTVFFLSFFISMILAVLSSTLETIGTLVGFVILLLVIALGVLFDFIGIAVASADAGNFNSMAARGNPAGSKGVWLVKNADRVSSFCNDVIGDISGILSGAIGATLSISLFAADTPWDFWGDLVLTGAISAVTVGGKAMFKGLAMAHSQKVVAFLCQVMCLFSPRARKQKKKGSKEN